jgi:predicted ATPase/transcriptional regulator with XRE-family HTH domain
MDSTASFGYWLRRRRKALDLTQVELARQVGCAVVTIRKIEADESRPSRQMAERLATCLGIPVEERAAFLKVARAELATNQLALTTQPQNAPISEQLVAQALPADLPPELTRDRPPTNLPIPPTPLIGRVREVAAVRALLQRDNVRLVTLTGPGGTGKTRLGLQVTAELLDDMADGAWFVNLAPISDPTFVASTLAQVLGVREVSGQPLVEGLKAFLRAKRILVLLDNFEQVVDAAPVVAELLAAAPGLKVLVTSRMRLRLSGEHEAAVAPLALPDHNQPLPLERLAQYDAVRLFIERAQAVKAEFALTDENAAAVAEICERLDGLPLAIELAAVRIKLFPPQAILSRLDRRLKLLSGGARDLPVRQQTIRNTIAWSYDLLDQGEQTLFARLGVFVGGGTLAAAEAVCNADGNLPLDVVDGIAALLDKSLLRQEYGGVDEPRFTMLETIREYALEQLAARGETAALQRQHTAYYLALAATGQPQAFADTDVWLALLKPEQDNVRAALGWALQGGDVALGVRLAAVLGPFWYQRCDWAEGRRWLEAALAVLSDPAGSGEIGEEWQALRASVLLGVGVLTFNLGDSATSRAHLEASVSLYREVGDKAGLAEALYELGAVAEHAYNDYEVACTLQKESVALLRELGNMWGVAWALLSLAGATLGLGQHEQARGLFEESAALFRTLDVRQVFWALSGVAGVLLNQDDYAAARAVYEDCLAMARELGNPWQLSCELHWLGAVVAYQGDYVLAAALLEESLALAREMRQQVRSADLLNMLGEVAHASGDYSRAVELYQESLALNSAFEKRSDRARSLRNLGRVSLERGEYERAAAHFTESLRLLHTIGDRIGLANCLGSVAGLAGAQGWPERAARLFGAAEALREATRMPRWQGILYEETYNRYRATTRAELGEAAWATAWTIGRAMPLEQAIADALDEATATGIVKMPLANPW